MIEGRDAGRDAEDWRGRGSECVEGEASSGVASLMVGVPRGRASRVGDGSPGRDVGNRMGMES